MKIEILITNWINKEYELDVISRQQLFLKFLELWFQEQSQGQSSEITKIFSNKYFINYVIILFLKKSLIGFNFTTRGYTYFIKKGVNPPLKWLLALYIHWAF